MKRIITLLAFIAMSASAQITRDTAISCTVSNTWKTINSYNGKPFAFRGDLYNDGTAAKDSIYLAYNGDTASTSRKVFRYGEHYTITTRNVTKIHYKSANDTNAVRIRFFIER